MHILLPKHTRINEKEVEKILASLNISKSQLPMILSTDPALPEGSIIGDIIKIERKDENNNVEVFFRVVV